jgi:MscS family membrane protein
MEGVLMAKKWCSILMSLVLASAVGVFALTSVAAGQAKPQQKQAASQNKASTATAKAVDPEKKAPEPEKKPENQEQKGDSAGNPNSDDTPIPINSERIDEAGQMLGKKIDEAGKGASRTVGQWINAKAFLGVTWLKLLVCLLLLIAVVAIERTVRYLVSLQMAAKKDEEGGMGWWRLFLDALSEPLSLFIRVYGIYWALSPILGYFDTSDAHGAIHRVAGKAADIGGTIALFWFVYRFVNVFDLQMRRWAGSRQNSIDDMLVPLVGKTFRVFIIAIGSIMIVQNMTGIEIGPLIASLGIGGLAIALAGKDSIANFLGSLTILLDKPFQVGERIAIDKHEGFVEDVGFRSTRIRTLSGNLVSIPNEKIINSTLENISRRPFLRWHTDLTLTCDTPAEKVERAVRIVGEILDSHEGMRPEYPPRVHFNGFNEWSLNLSLFAWYHPADFWRFQDWVQRTCLEIMQRFEAEGIEFAFPTQTVYQYELGGRKADTPDHLSRMRVSSKK